MPIGFFNTLSSITVKPIGKAYSFVSSKRVRVWEWIKRYIFILVILLFIGANIGLFFTYRQTSLINADTLSQKLLITENATERIEIQSEIDLKRDLLSQVWSFCGTDAFKTVAVSVLLALLLAALGKIFKIKEAFEERIRAQRQIRIDNQKECIENTEKMWDELYCMVSEIRFYNKDIVEEFNRNSRVDIKNRKCTIEDLLKRSEDFASRAEAVVNQWHFVFPILPKIGEESNRNFIKQLNKQKDSIINNELEKFSKMESDWKDISKKKKEVNSDENLPVELKEFKDKFGGISKRKYKKTMQSLLDKEIRDKSEVVRIYRRPSRLLVFFINILYEAASTVAYSIRKDEIENVETKGNKDKDIKNYGRKPDNDINDIEDLQNTLGVIQDVIKDMVHQYMIAILKCAVEPQNGYGDKEQADINKYNINVYLDCLFDNYIEMKKIVFLISPLPDIEGDRGKILQGELRVCLGNKKKEKENLREAAIEEIKKQTQDKKAKYVKEQGEKDITDECICSTELKNRIKADDIIRSWEFKYSLEDLKTLAKELSCITLMTEIDSRTRWLSYFNLTAASDYAASQSDEL